MREFFFFRQTTAYEMRISDWSSDVCSSDLFARLYAVPLAVAVTAVIVGLSTEVPASVLAAAWPAPVLVAPVFSFDAMIGIALPLFVVTMASQNLPGLAVLNANGYRPAVAPIFVSTGAASAGAALLGGPAVNLAAITAALCAGPEAYPDPGQIGRAHV